jgi:glutamate synthase (NADPH/NADH) small chain
MAEEEKTEKKKLRPNRVDMPKQTPVERIRNFNEVALGFTPELAMEEAKRCLQCKNSPCRDGCPVEVKIPQFIKAISEGDFPRAIKEMKEKNALPAVCGRVCPQEEQCEKLCVVGKKHEPVSIGRLERFIADWEASQGKSEIPQIAKSTGKKVAVVGCGPAGLTVAADLAVLGHEIHIFEALHEPGGVLIYGIPEFRLPKSTVRREMEYVKKLGVKVKFDFVVGKTRTISSFLEEYDAIFVGSGAGLPWFLGIPGENLNGVYSANEYLTRVNLMKGYLFPDFKTPIKRPHRVLTFGGGNVAMDCARTALRLGCDESHIVYRRAKEQLPARIEEVENAEEEGVIFDFLTNPIRLLSNDRGWLVGVECLKMELGEPDASGRRSPVPIEGSEFIMEADAAVCAIGNSPNPLIPQTTPGLTIGRKGNIEINAETGKTSIDRIWAGGDVATGAATVIMAMGAGRIAARSMHEYLSGN